MDIYLRILRVEEEAKSLKDVLLGFNEFIKSPIAIINKDYSVLDYYTPINGISDPLFNEVIKNGSWNVEIIKKVNSIFANFKNQNYFITKIGSRRRLFIRIEDEDQILGYIGILETDNDISKIDQDVIFHLGKCVKKFLLKDNAKEDKETFFSNLLINNYKQKEAFIEKANELNFDLSKKYNLYIFSLVKCIKASFNEVKDDFHHFFKDALITIKGNYLIVLSCLDLKKDTIESYLFKCKIYGIKSMKINSLNFLSNVFKLNTNLLTYLIKAKNEYILYKEEEFVYLLPILETDSLDDLFNMIDEKIIKIISCDIENKNDFLTTIYLYLKNEKSLLEASKQLYVHKNTINYRLRKMEEIADIDFNDPASNFNLLSSLNITMYLKAMGFNFKEKIGTNNLLK